MTTAMASRLLVLQTTLHVHVSTSKVKSRTPTLRHRFKRLLHEHIRLNPAGILTGAPRRLNTTRASARAADTALAADISKLDQLLSKGAEDEAVALSESLREVGTLKAFGRAAQVPKRSYTLEELRLNKIETKDFLAPADTTLNGVRNVLQGSFLVGLTAAFFTNVAGITQLIQWVIIVAFLLTVDQVGNAGGLEALVVDAAGRVINPTYARRVALHEAGHFLVAYLLGLLPKSFTLSSWEAFYNQRALNVQAGTTFCDAAFQREVATGKLSSASLDVYSCVALAGVATEWLRFGKAEGGLADVQQLDRLMRALTFTQAKADAEVRWAVLNVVTILRRHAGVQDKLAEAMGRGASVGECVALIETELLNSSDI